MEREQIISKLDFLYINETELANSVCDILNCNYYRGGNESDPIGCYGCDEQEEIVASQEYRIVDKKTFDYINNYIIAETEKAKKDAVIETCDETNARTSKGCAEMTKLSPITIPDSIKTKAMTKAKSLGLSLCAYVKQLIDRDFLIDYRHEYLKDHKYIECSVCGEHFRNRYRCEDYNAPIGYNYHKCPDCNKVKDKRFESEG